MQIDGLIRKAYNGSFAVIVKDGFAAVALIALLFPAIFVTGLVILLVGLFKKKKPQQLA